MSERFTMLLGLVSLMVGVLYATLRDHMGAKTFSELVSSLRKHVAALGGLRMIVEVWRKRFQQEISRVLFRAWRTLVGADVEFTPYIDTARTQQIWLVRFSVAAISLMGCHYFGASGWFWIPGFCSFVILASVFHIKIINSTAQGYDGIKYWIVAIWAGAVLSFLVMMSIIIATMERVPSLEGWALVTAIVLSYLAGLNISTTALALQHRTVPWIQLSMGLIGIPFCLAWLFASVSANGIKPLFYEVTNPSMLEAGRLQTMSQRARWSHHAGWRKQDGQPITVALALSGGGYRAAVIHAGVLQAFDEKCVPIRYLTTVSGGSIIGAYYALGYRPELFKEQLVHSQPGLPDEFLAMWNEFANWWGTRTSSDTYSQHFAKVFFGSKVLGDTGLTPQLIVNATDVEQTEHAREVFFKGRSDHVLQLDNTRLADVVAASAAFPGPFQPKTILWLPEDGSEVLQARHFIDGGVVENTGYTGLARFLSFGKRTRTVPEKPPQPDYLIISDASAEGAPSAIPRKVDLWQLLSRSQDISFAFQERLIRAVLSTAIEGGEREGLPSYFLFIRAQDQDIQEKLQNEWYSLPDGSGKIRGDEIAREVSQYPTLNELNKEQVEKAFWLGHAMGKVRWEDIDGWRKSVTAQPNCPE